MLNTLTVVSALVSVASVAADLGKRSLFPQGLHDPLSAMDNSYNPPHSFFYVTPPQLCLQHASDAGCDTSKVQAIEITYGDCSTPWTICRCQFCPACYVVAEFWSHFFCYLIAGGNANMNIYDVLYRFGQIPVGVRSYVGSMLAAPASSCSAGSGGDFIVFHGDCAESVYNHEA